MPYVDVSGIPSSPFVTTPSRQPGGIVSQVAGVSAPRETAPFCETSASWPPLWTPRPEIEVLACDKFVGTQVATAQFRRRYGEQIKEPSDAAPIDRKRLDLAGHWVQIKRSTSTGPQLLWAGRISEQTEIPFGDTSPLANKPAGTTEYVAFGALRILERMNFHTSFWLLSGDVQELGWAPGFNQPQPGTAPGSAGATQPRGNRCTDPVAIGRSGQPGRLSYLFGGYELWSARNALIYVLEKYVNPALASGPVMFEAGGILSTLAQLKEYIPVQTIENVADLLARIIPERYGLTFRFVERMDTPTKQNFIGWELRVCSRAVDPVTIGTIQIPSEIVTRLPLLTDPKYEVAIERSKAQRYRMIRVVGERVISCFSAGPGSADATQLSAGWTSLLETQYRAATDQERSGDAFRDVFQTFVVRSGWNHQVGQANPTIPPATATGSTRPVFTPPTSGRPPYQRQIVATLPRLPLREQYDYTVDPPRLADGVATTDPYALGYLPPMVFAQIMVDVETPAGSGIFVATPYRWLVDRIHDAVPESHAEASVEALDHEYGVRLRSTPNHAYDLQTAASYATSEFTPEAGTAADWRTIDITIAVALDQRIVAEHALDAFTATGTENDGGVLEIEVPDAHFWWLAPNTIVKTVNNGYAKSPSAGVILRDDRYKLSFALAGALAKYQREQFAATIRIREIAPWGDILGLILAATYQQGVQLLDKCQITSVHFDFVTLTTTIGVGNA